MASRILMLTRIADMETEVASDRAGMLSPDRVGTLSSSWQWRECERSKQEYCESGGKKVRRPWTM